MDHTDLRTIIWKLSLYVLIFVNVVGTIIIISIALDHDNPARPSKFQLIAVALILYLISFLFYKFIKFCYRVTGDF